MISLVCKTGNKIKKINLKLKKKITKQTKMVKYQKRSRKQKGSEVQPPEFTRRIKDTNEISRIEYEWSLLKTDDTKVTNQTLLYPDEFLYGFPYDSPEINTNNSKIEKLLYNSVIDLCVFDGVERYDYSLPITGQFDFFNESTNEMINIKYRHDYIRITSSVKNLELFSYNRDSKSESQKHKQGFDIPLTGKVLFVEYKKPKSVPGLLLTFTKIAENDDIEIKNYSYNTILKKNKSIFTGKTIEKIVDKASQIRKEARTRHMSFITKNKLRFREDYKQCLKPKWCSQFLYTDLKIPKDKKLGSTDWQFDNIEIGTLNDLIDYKNKDSDYLEDLDFKFETSENEEISEPLSKRRKTCNEPDQTCAIEEITESLNATAIEEQNQDIEFEDPKEDDNRSREVEPENADHDDGCNVKGPFPDREDVANLLKFYDMSDEDKLKINYNKPSGKRTVKQIYEHLTNGKKDFKKASKSSLKKCKELEKEESAELDKAIELWYDVQMNKVNLLTKLSSEERKQYITRVEDQHLNVDTQDLTRLLKLFRLAPEDFEEEKGESQNKMIERVMEKTKQALPQKFVTYSCSYCEAVFKKQFNYHRHLYVKHRDHDEVNEILRLVKHYTCENCGKEFIEKARANDHITLCAEGVVYKCKRGCDEEFENYSKLTYHYLKMHPNKKQKRAAEKLKCKLCKKKFVKKSGLKKHIEDAVCQTFSSQSSDSSSRTASIDSLVLGK